MVKIVALVSGESWVLGEVLAQYSDVPGFFCSNRPFPNVARSKCVCVCVPKRIIVQPLWDKVCFSHGYFPIAKKILSLADFD